MKVIVVTDQAAGTGGMKPVERPDPDAARLASLSGANYGDVIVEVHASGFTGNELEWPSTWTDRLGRDRTPSIPGHELPGDVDFTVGAGVAMTGLTAWQGLFDHGRLQAGRSVLVHGAAGAVGSMATQLAREAGAYVIGTGRAAHHETALDFGAHEFVDLGNDALEDVGGVDLVFDVIGGDIQKRSAGSGSSRRNAGDRHRRARGPARRRPGDRLRRRVRPRPSR